MCLFFESILAIAVLALLWCKLRIDAEQEVTKNDLYKEQWKNKELTDKLGMMKIEEKAADWRRDRRAGDRPNGFTVSHE